MLKDVCASSSMCACGSTTHTIVEYAHAPRIHIRVKSFFLKIIFHIIFDFVWLCFWLIIFHVCFSIFAMFSLFDIISLCVLFNCQLAMFNLFCLIMFYLFPFILWYVFNMLYVFFVQNFMMNSQTSDCSW